MSTRPITWNCYEVIKALYIEKGFLGYKFPCYSIDPIHICNDTYTVGIAFRLMDVDTPPEIDELWEYIDGF